MPQEENGVDQDVNEADPIKQLKGETYRKFDKLSTQLEEMRQSQGLLLQQLANATAPKQQQQVAASDTEDLTSLMYDDPKRYHQIISERAASSALGVVRQEMQSQGQLNSTMTALAAEYPELTKADHELTKKAASIFAQLPENERQSTMAYKYAVKQAAEELSMQPTSKRPPSDDIIAGGGSNPYGAPRNRKKTDVLSPATEAWGEVLGLDTEDPDMRARLIKRSQRNDWSTPQNPLPAKKKGGRK